MSTRKSLSESGKSALTRKVEESAHSLEALNGPPCCSRSAVDMVLLSSDEKLTIWQQADDEWRKGVQELKKIFPNATAYRREKWNK